MLAKLCHYKQLFEQLLWERAQIRYERLADQSTPKGKQDPIRSDLYSSYKYHISIYCNYFLQILIRQPYVLRNWDQAVITNYFISNRQSFSLYTCKMKMIFYFSSVSYLLASKQIPVNRISNIEKRSVVVKAMVVPSNSMYYLLNQDVII